MIKQVLMIVAVVAILGGGVYVASKQMMNNQPTTSKATVPAGTTGTPTVAPVADSHGCVVKDGFMWDGKNQKCVRPWDSLTQAQRGPNMPNPASLRCKEDGGVSVVTKDEKGIERGTCTLKSGTVCNEWAYFRGDCK